MATILGTRVAPVRHGGRALSIPAHAGPPRRTSATRPDMARTVLSRPAAPEPRSLETFFLVLTSQCYNEFGGVSAACLAGHPFEPKKNRTASNIISVA